VIGIAAPEWEIREQNNDIRILSQKPRNAPGKPTGCLAKRAAGYDAAKLTQFCRANLVTME
jgi:hypothetical protein